MTNLRAPAVRRFVRALGLALALVMVVGPGSASTDEADWVLLGEAEGVELWEREVPGRIMPAFRAAGIVEEDLHDVFAVVYDVDKHAQWVHDCRNAQMLELKSPIESFIYHRINVTWPLGDRDATMRTTIEVVEPGEHIHISFKGTPHPKMPPLPGVTRMFGIEGHYDLRRVGEKRTRVEYQVVSDPRLNVPRVLVLPIARQMPLRTILNLRRQILRTRGEYAEFIRDWKARESSAS